MLLAVYIFGGTSHLNTCFPLSISEDKNAFTTKKCITRLKQNTIHVTTASSSFLLLHHSKRILDVDMVTLPSPSIFFVRLLSKFTAKVYYSPTVERQRHGWSKNVSQGSALRQNYWGQLVLINKFSALVASRSISVSEKWGKLIASGKKIGTVGDPSSLNIKFCLPPQKRWSLHMRQVAYIATRPELIPVSVIRND